MRPTKQSPVVSILFIAAMAILLTPLFSTEPTAALVLFGVLILAGLVVVTPKGSLFMALQVEIWEKDIIDNLYKNNEFALDSKDDSAFVIMGKIVHIPVAGAASQIKKNLTEFPATVTERADSELTYEIDTYYSMPRRIAEIDKYELSYDKRQSVIGEDQRKLIQDAMYGLLYRWAPSVANVVLTAGDATPTTLSGAAGNRKKFTKAAFAAVKRKMDAADIDPNGRVCLLTAEHYNDFVESLSDAERTDVGRVADLKKGVVGEYLGFKIRMRSSVLRYRGDSNAVAVVDEQAEDYAATADDRAASLFWQRDAVSRARGEVKMFDGTNRPEYYGDIYSFLMRLGGRIRRAVGVYAVVEELV